MNGRLHKKIVLINLLKLVTLLLVTVLWLCKKIFLLLRNTDVFQSEGLGCMQPIQKEYRKNYICVCA